jgi:hypothetical protein
LSFLRAIMDNDKMISAHTRLSGYAEHIVYLKGIEHK